MNDAALRPAESLLNNRLRRYKLRQMKMPDLQGRGKMSEPEGFKLNRVEGIDELIPEGFLERRCYEYSTIPESEISLKGKVIIQEEEQADAEARREREGLVLWTDGSRKEDEWVGLVEKVMKKPKISLPMSFVFAEEKCP